MWSDPKSTNMAYGNQWMNPTFYINMTNEQVDWSSLAHQWIKMKETSPVISPEQKVNIPLSEHSLLKYSQHVDASTQNPSNLAAVTQLMLSDYNISSNVTRNNIEKPRACNTWTLQKQQSIWNWVSTSTDPPARATEPVNSLRPLFVPPILSEPPPSFPMMTPNILFPCNNYWAEPNTTVPTPSESDHCNKLNMISKVDDRTQDPSFIDAAKRKQLPAWIREGLEKMEREKQRIIEQKQSFGEPDYSNSINENVTKKLLNSPINFDHETQMIDDDIELVFSNYNNDPENIEFVKNDSSPLIPRKTKAQIWEDTMLSLRTILTKLLMDVTNDMMLSVVKRVLKTTLQTDIRGNQNQTSLASKLGLGIYDSESESSDESDDGHLSTGRKELKQDSDEAIQERIMKRQCEFSNIEARILMELDQLEDKEKLVRSKFDDNIKLSGEMNDIGSQVVENIQTKGLNENIESNLSIDNSHDIVKKELPYCLNIENGHKQKKSKFKTSSSSSSSSSSRDSMDYTDLKHNYKKNDKIESKSSDKKTLKDSGKGKSRSRSRSNRSRSHSKHSSRLSCSRNYDKRSSRSSRSRRSRSPPSRHSYSRKYKNKQNSSSCSNDSSNNEHRYRR